jgi:glycosyltransferase involved in cell wall biosynthesis
LRIAIDALAARFGGTAYMVGQLASALAARDDVEHVWAIVTAGSIADDALRPVSKQTRIPVEAGPRLGLVRRAAWEATRLPALVREQSINRVLTVSGMLPRRPGCPVAVHLTNPVAYEQHNPANRLRRTLIRRTLRSAETLIVPTAAMGRLVEAHTGCGAVVLPLGVDHDLFTSADIPGVEILCVSDFYAHKRHDLALQAWSRLREPRPRLRFIGNPAVDPAAFAAVSEQARSLDPSGQTILVEGRVSLDALLAAYRTARVFLMPSERESFSMPLAEALTCGVPAVVRDSASLRETGAMGSMFIASEDPDAWAGALQLLLDDPDAHAQLRNLAVEHAQRFSWSAVAAAIVTGHAPEVKLGCQQ